MVTRKKIHLDGYNDKLKLAFEYQGRQHYEHIKLFHPTIEDFEAQKTRDRYKREMCKKKGITLIEIGFEKRNGDLRKIKFEEMDDFIRKELKANGIIAPLLKTKIDWRKINVAPPKYLNEIKRIAESKGGKCLSSVWLGFREKLEFVCAEGHHFWATPGHIKRKPSRPHGTWCRICMFKELKQNQLKYSKQDLDNLAISRGGPGSKCLSANYLGFHKKHLWKCANGHEFFARFDSVKGYSSKPKGTWCKVCYHQKRTKKMD